MSEQKTHDLLDFMVQVSAEMSMEYDRIQKRATEDPGTAGDQGEENWASLLRGWLPRGYEVVTKGRLISQEGVTSPQVDVVVLNGAYPKKLLDRKLFLAAGVAAAFECKTTLTAAHVRKAVENCVKIKSLYPDRTGTPYKELHAPVVYGLLAHSHSWKGENSTPEANIEKVLQEADRAFVRHPRHQLDLICVADLMTWTAVTATFTGMPNPSNQLGARQGATTAYIGHSPTRDQRTEGFMPVGTLVSHLTRRLAWEDPALRSLADYYRVVNVGGGGSGRQRQWPGTVYSDQIRRQVQGQALHNPLSWSEWSTVFF